MVINSLHQSDNTECLQACIFLPGLSYPCLESMQGLAQDAEKYKSTAAHVELSKKMYKRDPATAPVVGDRVPYVIIKVSISNTIECP